MIAAFALAQSLSITVIDGDTLRVHVPGIDLAADVRLADVDAPELRGSCALERWLGRRSKAIAERLVAGAERIEVVDHAGKSHGRTVARVEIDGENLGGLLIAWGAAVPHDEVEAADWCAPAAARALLAVG